MAFLLKGKEVVHALNKHLRIRVKDLNEKNVTPTLAIIRLGNRPDDLAYEKSAKMRAKKIGIAVRQYVFSEHMMQDALLYEIEKINRDDSIHGVLLFRPLPDHIDDEVVRNVLSPEKDIDGITDVSQAAVYSETDKGFPPCTAEACIEILKFFDVALKGKNVAVIGRSQVIGKPVALMLMREDATVTVCHTKTVNMADICKEKDIIIAAAGHLGTVTREFLSEGQVVIDVAVNFDQDGNMCGDVDFAAADEIVSAITPVPGGVGTVTTSMLMKHVVQAAERAGTRV